MSEMTLYDFELDDACYAVRLLLSMLGRDYRKVAVDVVPGGEPGRPPLLDMAPLGCLPILTDGELVLWDSGAILAYLARACDAGGTWLPAEPARFGLVQQWLHFAAGDLAAASRARAHALFDDGSGAGDDAAARDKATALRALRVMEDHMTHRAFAGGAWFVGDGPTLADLALFPAFALSRDYGVDHEAYPALRRWLRRVRSLPGFVVMPGVPAYH